jgi:iron(III) transport system substrate-binding protein
MKSPASAKAEWEEEWDKLLKAAKNEGQVMIYGRVGPEIRKALKKEFLGKYGIDLDFLYLARGRELAARMKKERRAGLYLADVVVHGATTGINLLKPTGIFESMEPLLILPEVTDPKVWRPDFCFIDRDRMIKPMRASFFRYAARNTNLVKEGEINSYRDLLNLKWKGRIVMYDPTGPGSGNMFISLLSRVWGHEQTLGFQRQLIKQEPTVIKDLRLPWEWLARGKYSVGIALSAELCPEMLDLGAPVAQVKVIEGGLLGSGAATIAVVNKRPHPNATAVFVNWILTREGQTVWSEADGHPGSRLDLSNEWIHPTFLPGPGEKVTVDNEESCIEGPKRMKESKEIFAPLLK